MTKVRGGKWRSAGNATSQSTDDSCFRRDSALFRWWNTTSRTHSSLAWSKKIAPRFSKSINRLSHARNKYTRSAIYLFHDLLTAIGGVGHSDEVAYPNPKERTLVRIEVLLRYDDKKIGSERWTIRHDANSFAVYQVTLVPDEEGSTDFTVSKAQ